MSDKKKILAIDDDASVCAMYENGLPLLGYEVHCASSAGKAKAHLKTDLPDLILMDVMMPDQDGISLTQEIRSDPKTASIPIIVVSGLSDAGTLNDALLYGAVDFLVKPVDFEVLKVKLERVLAIKEERKTKKG